MNEIESMKRYVRLTKISPETARKYSISVNEFFAVAALPGTKAVSMAFEYGLAKGYRAARAEVQA